VSRASPIALVDPLERSKNEAYTALLKTDTELSAMTIENLRTQDIIGIAEKEHLAVAEAKITRQELVYNSKELETISGRVHTMFDAAKTANEFLDVKNECEKEIKRLGIIALSVRKNRKSIMTTAFKQLVELQRAAGEKITEFDSAVKIAKKSDALVETQERSVAKDTATFKSLDKTINDIAIVILNTDNGDTQLKIFNEMVSIKYVAENLSGDAQKQT
jgi:hypothetical protein